MHVYGTVLLFSLKLRKFGFRKKYVLSLLWKNDVKMHFCIVGSVTKHRLQISRESGDSLINRYRDRERGGDKGREGGREREGGGERERERDGGGGREREGGGRERERAMGVGKRERAICMNSFNTYRIHAHGKSATSTMTRP